MASHIKVPQGGQKIVPGQPIPDNPIIPFIEGDGIGIDITPVMIKVIDAAVEKAYGGKKKIHWMEVYAGEKSTRLYGPDEWLPKETFDALKEYSVSIKGPMTTPVGGGIRSLNVALRQELDLYQCVRPVQYFKGVPSPLKHPELTNMVIFRENTEDIYAGIEWANGSDGARKVIKFLQEEMGVKKIRFPGSSGIGIKPVSVEGTQRLVRAAIKYAVANDRKSVTIVHKGNIMKFTEGLFRDAAYELAQKEFGAELIDGGPWCKFKNPNTGREIIIKDAIADAFLQQILLRPAEYDVIATLQPERRLHLRRAGRAGRRHRHRPRRQHLRPVRLLRGHPRHRAQVRRPGQGEPRFPHPLRRDDAAPPGLGRGGQPGHQVHGSRHRRQTGHLRLRPPHGRRQRALLLRLWRCDDRPDVSSVSASAAQSPRRSGALFFVPNADKVCA